MKTGSISFKKIHIDHWSPEISPCIYSQLAFDSGAKVLSIGKEISSMSGTRTMKYSYAKNKGELLNDTID